MSMAVRENSGKPDRAEEYSRRGRRAEALSASRLTPGLLLGLVLLSVPWDSGMP